MKLLIAASLFAALTALLYLPAGADDEDGVEILVTPKIVAISIAEGQLDYGSPEVGSIDNRPNPDDFTVVNESTVGVDLQISGTDSVSDINGAPGWTLGAAPGPDAYVHRFSLAVTPVYPGEFTTLMTAPAPFTTVAIDGSVDIKLSLDMPTSTTSLDRQVADVTVVALEDN